MSHQTTQPTRSSRAWPAALTGVLLAGLALRLYRLGAQSLWLDEGGTWAEVTRKGWGALLADLLSPDAAYPLYHLVVKAWVGLAGDAEWALRLPSALAGAAGALALYLAASELLLPPSDNHRRTTQAQAGVRALLRPWPFALLPLAASLLMATSPFAIWQAQDAKAYSMLTLCAALLLWRVLRALRRGLARDWLVLLALALVSLLVHRLALLALVAALLALALVGPFRRQHEPRTENGEPGLSRRSSTLSSWFFVAYGRWQLLLAALLGAAVAIYGVVRAVGAEQRGGSGHVPAGPLQGLWLALTHFALDRGNLAGWLGLPLLAWMLPALALTLWGLALLARDAWRGNRLAAALLYMFAAPLLLFAVALAFARLFESRYVTVAFPAWLLVIAYPLRAYGEPRTTNQKPARHARFSILGSRYLPFVLYAATLLVSAAALLQPQHGLFSGAPVKEQWREGIAALATRAHPDDLLILHPYYVQALWDYYAPRVTPDPLPQPISFDLLGQGYCRDVARDDQAALVECYRRNYEAAFDQLAQGRKRMLMLLAPDHARTIDPPKAGLDDRYGFLGLRFQYAEKNGMWPCGGDKFVGVELMCASFPSFYRQVGPQSIPQPATRLAATFGGELRLRGYTLALLGGQLRPGGRLPVALYWEAAVPPTRNYTMFLHLCRDCAVPPLANDDAPPLLGYFPAGQTSTWQPNDPVHDERSLALPADLPPGRYTLLLGVYPAGDPAERARLPVTSTARNIGGTRLILGEIQIDR